MSWLRIEGKMPHHEKVAPLSDAAFRLHVTGGAWCVEYETDGRIPAGIPRTLTAAPRGKALESAIAELVDGRLWIPFEGGGWDVYNYLVYNLSAQQWAELKASKAAAGRIGGLRSAEARAQAKSKQLLDDCSSRTEAEPKQTPKPIRLRSDSDPNQIPPSPPSEPTAAPTPAKPAPKPRRVKIQSQVDPGSTWNPEQSAKLRALGRDIQHENEKFIEHHRSKGTLSAAWVACRNTWVLKAKDGYGAPIVRNGNSKPPGLELHESNGGNGDPTSYRRGVGKFSGHEWRELVGMNDGRRTWINRDLRTTSQNPFERAQPAPGTATGPAALSAILPKLEAS